MGEYGCHGYYCLSVDHFLLWVFNLSFLRAMNFSMFSMLLMSLFSSVVFNSFFKHLCLYMYCFVIKHIKLQAWFLFGHSLLSITFCKEILILWYSTSIISLTCCHSSCTLIQENSRWGTLSGSPAQLLPKFVKFLQYCP